VFVLYQKINTAQSTPYCTVNRTFCHWCHPGKSNDKCFISFYCKWWERLSKWDISL